MLKRETNDDNTDFQRIIGNILAGEKSARRDVVLLNSAAALVAAGRVDSIAQALPLVAESLDSGAARKKLEQLVEFTSRPHR